MAVLREVKGRTASAEGSSPSLLPVSVAQINGTSGSSHQILHIGGHQKQG